MKSLLKEIGPVSFPENTGERVYMRPFTIKSGLPSHLQRWQKTVDAMLRGVETDGPIYLMIDQGLVRGGFTHRRKGAHIDGNWIPSLNGHGGHGKHRPISGSWSDDNGGWKESELAPEGIILASDVYASCAYIGDVKGEIKSGGDCSDMDLSLTNRVPLLAGKAYAGNVFMVHESLPVEFDCLRTLVRLNVPGWEPTLN